MKFTVGMLTRIRRGPSARFVESEMEQPLQRISRLVSRRVESMCAVVALCVARHPELTIAVGVTMSASLMLGWLTMDYEDLAEKLWAPQDTRAFRDRDFIEARFGDPAAASVALVECKDALSSASLARAFDLFDQVVSISSRDGDRGYVASCELAYWGEGCQKESVLAVWAWNRTAFQADTRPLASIRAANRTRDCCSPASRTVSLSRVVAGDVLRFVFYLQTSLNEKSRLDPHARRLELAFDRRILAFDAPEWHRALPLTTAGVADNVTTAFDRDRLFVNLAFAFIVAYAYCALASRDSLRSRGLLGIGAVATVALAVGAGFGIAMLCGVPLPRLPRSPPS